MKTRYICSLLLLWCFVFVQLEQTVAEIDVSSESVDHRLDGMEAAAEAALAERTAGATKYKELVSQVHELMQESKRLEEQEQELVRRTYAVEDLVRKANAVQLKYLASQLNLTIQKNFKSEQRQKMIEMVKLSKWT